MRRCLPADVFARLRHPPPAERVGDQYCWEPPAREPKSLPGTELKALLARIGIKATPTCSCNKRAKLMDERGCDWCEQNIDEIDKWLAEEARKRNVPYLSLAGRALIRLAIRRARKKDNSR